MVPENSEKQNLDEHYTNQNQKHVACSHGYKLVCVNDKFSKSFKYYLNEDAVYNFINSMVEKSKYWTNIMKKHFHKELMMTKKDNEYFKNSAKCWSCDNDCDESDVKVRDHCRITGKYRGSAYRDCSISVESNHKVRIVIHNLKYYNSHLIMQEPGKLSFKINVLLNGL